MEVGAQSPFLIVGLGNPGSRYAQTRHNLGFMAVEAFAASLGLSWRGESRFEGNACAGRIADKRFYLLLPDTYMNLSGRSVRKALDYLKAPVAQLLVVCDDAALPFGSLRLRKGGSSGGHNGLASIIESTGTPHFARLRLGIDRPLEGTLEEHVLTAFSPSERERMPGVLQAGERAIELYLTLPLDMAMTRLHADQKQVEDKKTKQTGHLRETNHGKEE